MWVTTDNLRNVEHTSEVEEDDFGVVATSSVLGKVMAAIKKKINYTGDDKNLDKSPEFLTEMRRWSAHEKKYKLADNFKRFRPLELMYKRNKPIFMKFCRGTVAVSTRIIKPNEKNRRNVDYVNFNSTKCPQCWRNGVTTYKNCPNHSSEGLRHIALVKDETNSVRDVVTTIQPHNRYIHKVSVEWDKEIRTGKIQRSVRVRNYLEKSTAGGKSTKFVAARAWKVKAGRKIQERLSVVLNSLNVSISKCFLVIKF